MTTTAPQANTVSPTGNPSIRAADITKGRHVSRSWPAPVVETPFDCDCTIASCGFAVSSERNCVNHVVSRTRGIQEVHAADKCPGGRR
jgi:hypothetical protein